MRVRSWPGTWLALVPALLFFAPAVSDEFRLSPAVLSSHCFADDASCCDISRCDTSYCDTSYCDTSNCYTSCCDASCCDPATCSDCCCPLWTVRAGAIFLRRDNQSNVPLTNGDPSISSGDLAFNDYQAGPHVTLMRHGFLDTAYTLELTYFGVQDSNTAASAGATTYFTNPVINFGARTVVADYRSRLDSTEINFRRDWSDWFTVLAGFRWVELSDELAADLGGGATTDINVNNHLYGAQIGAEVAILRGERFSLLWFGKAGIYGNSADQTTTTTNVGGAVPEIFARNGQTAFLGEMDLTLKYEISDHWSILGGYRAIWFDGVALAPNQLAATNIATGVATLNNTSQPIYHGFTVAAEFVW